MIKRDNGGPAFPFKAYLSPRDTEPSNIPGMSLRAYVATQAMQAIIGITTPADALIAELGKEGK
jgi:hypothetical protein